ncbi:MAG TPA: hypothetical protein VGP62_08950 [Bryobacteraceae bacterium]|jgi:hypothetical protein|nr:hypothetical protein [Bryobacteraceae bacterium]
MKFRLILLSCALALAAFAADVTGKWTYEMQGRNGAMTGTLNLKADGSTLTGTVSGRGGETEISDGKIDGDNVSFTVIREFNGNKMTQKYTGTVTGDGIKFKVEIEGSDRPAREFVAKKVSAT